MGGAWTRAVYVGFAETRKSIGTAPPTLEHGTTFRSNSWLHSTQSLGCSVLNFRSCCDASVSEPYQQE